jgi:hypothetical protein
MYNIDQYFHITYFVYVFLFYCLSVHTNIPKYIRKAIVNKYNLDDTNLLVETVLETTVEPIIKITEEPVIEKYEDKYLKKFKEFTMDYHFTDEEVCLERDKYVEFDREYKEKWNKEMSENQDKLNKMQKIIDLNPLVNGFGDEVIVKLIKYFSIEDLYEDDPDSLDLNEIYNNLKTEYEEYEAKRKEIEDSVVTEEELNAQAHSFILNKKLEGYINNYVLEMTPLGNVYMRYNHSKKSFEYFSNNTIPYRYLEAIGRKYVLTFRCKTLFVDLEEELNKAQEKEKEKEKYKEREKEKQTLEMGDKPASKTITAKFKNYNKDNKIEMSNPSKNRQPSAMILPPQIKANLPVVNSTNENHLLKENANRYTWEGRVVNLPILKKVDRKTVDKKYAMSFADFKQMQQNKK